MATALGLTGDGVAPPRVPRPDLRVPSTEEMRTLVDAAAGTPWGLPVLIAATTGMRRSEVLALQWSDVDLEAGTASKRRGKTNTARRTIHVPASTVVALRAHRRAQAERRLLCGVGWLDEDLMVDRGDGDHSVVRVAAGHGVRRRSAPRLTCRNGNRRDESGPSGTCLRDVPWRAMSQAAEIERGRPGLVLYAPKEAARLVSRVTPVDAVGLEERAASLAKRSIKRESKLWALDLAIRCMDLTTLEGTDTVGKVVAMCAKAVRPNPLDDSIPAVAAVGLYPHLVPVALGQLKGTEVKVASVAGSFPAGLGPLGARLAEIREVVDLGAHEIDIVLNRSLFLGGRYAECFEELVAARDAAGSAHLKVILEAGELGSYDRIRQASVLAMAAGADFIKTSTGKIGVNATLPSALCMMEAARDFRHETGHRVGVKVAGGVRASKQAIQYLVLVYETLGPEWMTPGLFRIGASTLLNDVLMQIDKERTGRYQGPDYFTID